MIPALSPTYRWLTPQEINPPKWAVRMNRKRRKLVKPAPPRQPTPEPPRSSIRRDWSGQWAEVAWFDFRHACEMSRISGPRGYPCNVDLMDKNGSRLARFSIQEQTWEVFGRE